MANITSIRSQIEDVVRDEVVKLVRFGPFREPIVNFHKKSGMMDRPLPLMFQQCGELYNMRRSLEKILPVGWTVKEVCGYFKETHVHEMAKQFLEKFHETSITKAYSHQWLEVFDDNGVKIVVIDPTYTQFTYVLDFESWSFHDCEYHGLHSCYYE